MRFDPAFAKRKRRIRKKQVADALREGKPPGDLPQGFGAQTGARGLRAPNGAIGRRLGCEPGKGLHLDLSLDQERNLFSVNQQAFRRSGGAPGTWRKGRIRDDGTAIALVLRLAARS